MTQALFIGATGQNVGKTTLCLGLQAALRKRFARVGFIKPVGQQHIETGGNLKVDKDVVLFKQHFQLASPYQDMSPVILPTGFTRDFLDQKVDLETLSQKIKTSFRSISEENDFILVEGTGHIGVGSIVQLNNAKIASLLNLEMILIASGGLGSAHDDLALNFAMCQAYGVKVRGVILNRVLDEKRAMVEEYFPKALKHWGIPLIGCIPYSAFLNTPSLKDFETLFEAELIAGNSSHYCHFEHPRLIAGSLEAYQDDTEPSELIITPASREDIILETLKRQRQIEQCTVGRCAYALILTGRKSPSPSIVEKIRQADFPALYAPLCSYQAMKMITSFTAKIRCEDHTKIEQAIHLIEKNIDFDLLLNSNLMAAP
jgi:dethiobiotin synthase